MLSTYPWYGLWKILQTEEPAPEVGKPAQTNCQSYNDPYRLVR